MTHSQTQGAEGAGTKTAATAWLLKRLKAARSDSEAHPEGHSNRTFYAGQAIAYENVLSFLEEEKPAPAPAATSDVRSLLRTARSGLATYGAGAFEGTIAQIDAILAFDPATPAPAATSGVPVEVREAVADLLKVEGQEDEWRQRGQLSTHFAAANLARHHARTKALDWALSLITAQPAGQAGDAGEDARTVLTEACKPWEHYTGEPPDDGSPLSGVFVAGMVYTERLLAKLLDVTHYEGGDGSEDFDNDATQTLRNILTGAGLWDADENRAVKPAPDSTRTGAAETEETYTIEMGQAAESYLYSVGYDKSEDKFPKLFRWSDCLAAMIAARPEAPSDAGWRERVRHVKRGTEYEVLGEAEAQVSGSDSRITEHRDWLTEAVILEDGDKLTVYRGTDGRLWCRPTDEFRDGRFLTLGNEESRHG